MMTTRGIEPSHPPPPVNSHPVVKHILAFTDCLVNICFVSSLQDSIVTFTALLISEL